MDTLSRRWPVSGMLRTVTDLLDLSDDLPLLALAAGEDLIREGSHPEQMYVLVSGSLVVERDGVEQRFFEGCFGIFGHGNVAGIGQALYQHPDLLTYYQARNEQAMVHTSVGFARMKNRLAALACTSSIGPGATNLLTGIADAHLDRAPMVAITGQASSDKLHKEAHQVVDIVRMFEPVTKWNTRGERVEAIGGGQLRLLFAYLVLHRRRPSSHAELVEAVWPAAAPPAGLRTISSTLLGRPE